MILYHSLQASRLRRRFLDEISVHFLFLSSFPEFSQQPNTSLETKRNAPSLPRKLSSKKQNSLSKPKRLRIVRSYLRPNPITRPAFETANFTTTTTGRDLREPQLPEPGGKLSRRYRDSRSPELSSSGELSFVVVVVDELPLRVRSHRAAPGGEGGYDGTLRFPATPRRRIVGPAGEVHSVQRGVGGITEFEVWKCCPKHTQFVFVCVPFLSLSFVFSWARCVFGFFRILLDS